MAKSKPLSNDNFNKLLIKLNIISLKFNGQAYKIYDQNPDVAESKVREDIDLFMLFQFAPHKVISVLPWKAKIALEFYKLDRQNLSIFDTDVLIFLELFEPIMDDNRFTDWWKLNEFKKENEGMYMLVQIALGFKEIKY